MPAALAPHLALGIELAGPAFSSLDRPEVIGPAGTKTAGRWPKDRAPMTSPGTILSQTPRKTAASNIWCDKAIAVDSAMTSRENSDSSMPASPWVTPSHMAGTPPATWAVAPTSRTASRMIPGKRSNG